MNKVYKISGATKVILTFGILLTLVIVGVFIYTCIKPAQAGDKLAGIIIMGIIMLMFVVLIIYCILALKDNVVLTDKGIKLHLLPQTFPLHSLKPNDDEVAWKDIKEVSCIQKESTTYLVLKLLSGEVKEFGIGHLEKHLGMDIEDYFHSGVDVDDQAKIEADEKNEGDPNRPGTLEWSKKKKFRQVLLCVLVQLIGIVLIAVRHRWGLALVFLALLFGCFFLYQFYLYNSFLLSPRLSKNGRMKIAFSGLLLAGLLVLAILVSDATLPTAS